MNRPSILMSAHRPKPDESVGCTALDEDAAQRILDLFERAASTDATFREHSEHVADLSVRVGQALGLDDHELEVLGLAAAVHDVGKLAVDPDILAKPSALDDEEWESMRRHPAAGAELLEPCAAPAEVVEIVRSHHERWDGGGYPDGLAGEQIPLGARIIAVVDSYCAMVESRPYRPPRRPAGARAELLAGAGTQFDAQCARAAYRLVAAIG
jgi:HD-GYP domain-containing protein (c-di-GMP phosphodiesterase class II)